MELALYAPGLGYYMAGSTKLGAAGDFITAPELSPLFAQCLARQAAQLVGAGIPDILEVGAGSGALAAGLLETLAALDRLPRRYLILEVSAELRERQRERCARCAPELVERIEWIETLPERLSATVVVNEVLDAMPVHVVRCRSGRLEEMGVGVSANGDNFERRYRPAAGELLSIAESLALPEDYESEINLAARGFIRRIGTLLERGAMFLIDYGFPAAEYYHPQRLRGTLMCHYRHRAHDDPFIMPGLQDITAHVDFTAMAEAAAGCALSILGYTTQAQFLINCGILDALSATPVDDVRAYAPLATQAQKLLSPAEMGELFKVLAVGRAIDEPLLGFSHGDRTPALAARGM